MYGKGLLKGLGITFKHTFEKDITIQYPEEFPFLQDRYRGRLAFQFEKCIACGLCTKTCPNRVLSFVAVKEEGSKKNKLLNYTIDLQYCMFCNLCVEICPTDTLYFSHDFELAKYHRDEIKIVYHRPPELDLVPEPPVRSGAAMSGEAAVEPLAAAAPAPPPEADAKRLKQVEAMKTVLGKNPHKALGRVLAEAEDINILAGLISADAKKLSKLAELLIDDQDKAQKFSTALVSKAKKEQSKEGGEPA